MHNPEKPYGYGRKRSFAAWNHSHQIDAAHVVRQSSPHPAGPALAHQLSRLWRTLQLLTTARDTYPDAACTPARPETLLNSAPSPNAPSTPVRWYPIGGTILGWENQETGQMGTFRLPVQGPVGD